MILGGVVVAGVVPFLVFLTLSGGVGEYFRSALLYVTRDAERTSFSFPRFALDISQPMVALTRSPRGGEIHVNVRWEPIPDDQRGDRESRYQLARGEQQDGATWSYVLQDASSANIKALVSDPLVNDTHGLDRTNFSVEGQGLRLESQFDTVANGTAYLYHPSLLLPALGVAMLYRLRRTTSHPRVVTSLEHMVPLFGTRRDAEPDVSQQRQHEHPDRRCRRHGSGHSSWIIAALASQDGRRMLPNRAVRVLARVNTVAVLAAAFLAANGLIDWWRHGREVYYASGPLHAATRMAEVWDALGIPPTALSEDEEQPRLLRVASYLNACTDSTDRVFVLGDYPELYYFSDRPFAGGHAWLLPLYYTDDTDETRIVARLRRTRVPIVVTETASEYEEEYRPVFERVHAYLEDEVRARGRSGRRRPAALACARPCRARADRSIRGTRSALLRGGPRRAVALTGSASNRMKAQVSR